jgi:hypothetical protein
MISPPQPFILPTPVAVATHLDFAPASFTAPFLPYKDLLRGSLSKLLQIERINPVSS